MYQVKVLDVEEDEEMEFKIVGSTEANSLDGKISNESPVGRALLGKKAGETVDVETQAGMIRCTRFWTSEEYHKCEQ